MTTAMTNKPTSIGPIGDRRRSYLNMADGQAKIVVTGTDDCPTFGIVKMTHKGLVQKIRTTVHLDRSAGHVWKLKDEFLISASGYHHLNRALGVSFFSPDTVMREDGGIGPNPCVLRDDQGNIYSVIHRCVGFGINAVGNMTAICSTLYYDLKPAFAQDVLKKWRPWNKDTKSWGTIYDVTSVPQDVIDNPQTKCLDLGDGCVLSVDLRHCEVIDLIASNNHRRRFATRNAETIVQRNILKKFIGREKLDDSLSVSVDSWPQADWRNFGDIKDLAERISAGDVKLNGEDVQIQRETISVDGSETESFIVEEVGDDISAPQDQSNDTPAASVSVEPTVSLSTPSPLTQLREKIRKLYFSLGQDKALMVFGECNIEGLEELVVTGNEKKLIELLKALEDTQMTQVLSDRVAAMQSIPIPNGKEAYPDENQPDRV